VRSPHEADELRERVELALGELALPRELGPLQQPIRYAVEGGKRLRGTICLGVAEAMGSSVEDALPAACALELVQAFSLVHDDLPALDDDAERRGRPSVWAEFGEATAVLTGDALLAESFRLAASYGHAEAVRELAEAALGMIGGQQLDLNGGAPDETLHRLKTGRLFAAAVGLGLVVAEVPHGAQAPWRAFGEELGPLFQLVDDLLDADGTVLTEGAEATRRRADAAAERALGRLAEIDADTTVLESVVRGMAVRVA
jgi:geranylgeranyl pyrophosphate synthase